MAKPNFRFTIKAENERRVFLSAQERANGKFNLIVKPQRNLGYINHDPASTVITQRYSIHDSKRSEHFTTIHFTAECKDGTGFDVAQLTDAIKKRSGFAILQFIICPDLGISQYRLSVLDKATIHNIGEYNPKLWVFCYAVLVGPPDLSFQPTPPVPFHIAQYKFKKLSLVLLWCYLTAPSSTLATNHFVSTFPPEEAIDEEDAEIRRSVMEGKSPDDCIALLSEVREIAKQQHLNALIPNDEQNRKGWDAMAVYFRDADYTPEFYAHMRKTTGNPRWPET